MDALTKNNFAILVDMESRQLINALYQDDDVLLRAAVKSLGGTLDHILAQIEGEKEEAA